QPLRAPTQVPDPRGAAGRTAGGQGRRPAAVVASQGRPGLVVDQRPVAIGARLDVPAVPANHDRRGASPVQDEDGLLPAGGVEGRQAGDEPAREQAAVAGGQLLTKINDLNGWRAANGTDVEHDPVVLPGDL